MRRTLMKKRGRSRSVQLLDTQAILAANATFYTAFSTLDYQAMEDLWLPDNSSICVFPSSKPLQGFRAILKSWQHAVDSMDGQEIRNWMAPDEVRFDYLGTNKATLVCDELIFLSTTSQNNQGNVYRQTDVVNKFRARNMFKKVNGRWYMCYHEASLPEPSDILGLSTSSSMDSKSTFLTMITKRTDRERGRGWLRFLRWATCKQLDCTGA